MMYGNMTENLEVSFHKYFAEYEMTTWKQIIVDVTSAFMFLF
jgi:hypothetical protein